MAYSNPLSWSIGDTFDIDDINPSAGYVVQPFGSEIAYVYLNDGNVLTVDKDGKIIVIG